MSTTAKIASKGCKSTGITEELAQSLHNQLGKKVLCVVELVAETRSEKRNGDESVSLSILTIEPAPSTMTEDHLRELARAFHYERKIGEEGDTLPLPGDSPEPTADEVTKAGAQHRPHDYVPVGDDLDQCDECGGPKDALVHADLSTLDDPFTGGDENNEGGDDT